MLQREKVTAPELAEMFEVSRRTINRDIEAFNKLNIDEINTAMEAIYHAWERGSTIYVMDDSDIQRYADDFGWSAQP